MVSSAVHQHIINSYRKWNDYAEYQAGKAGIPDEAGDILDEVILSLLQKSSTKLNRLLSKKKEEGTELDFFVLKMIKINAHSKTSPYRHKTKNVPLDQNISPGDLDPEDLQQEDEIDQEIKTLQRTRQAREILESLDISDRDKEIFSWKFFADNSLNSWSGPESYTTVCNIFNRVRRKMISRIKNPFKGRRKWTAREVEYLKAEYPHRETMSIAHYLGRNYNSVALKANQLGLKKTLFQHRKKQLKSSPFIRKYQ